MIHSVPLASLMQIVFRFGQLHYLIEELSIGDNAGGESSGNNYI
jgi:hypothetical protein